MLQSAIAAAEQIRARLRAGFAGLDAGALAARASRGLSSVGGIASHPLLRNFVGEVHATLVRVCLYACVVAAFGLVGAEFVARSGAKAVTRPVAQPDWIEVVRPIPAFALAIPEITEEPRYAIQRNAASGGRKDILTFGEPNSGAMAAIEILRPGAEDEQFGEREETSVPELRLSGRPAVPRTIETKFGAVAVEEFKELAAGTMRRCLRFGRNFDDPRLEISGRFCNAGLELVDRGLVACALDRLTLLAAGSEPKLGALFARAELKRTFCGQNSVFIAATPKRNDWIEAARDPLLRGRN